MSVKVVSFFDFKSAPWPDDWSDQELAEFYRVEASLIRANIPIETDRGRSDEGDPWFVFCNANTGEIIVHFARFDGTYLVASPALDGCARGRDFRALIEAQLASHPLVIPKAQRREAFHSPGRVAHCARSNLLLQALANDRRGRRASSGPAWSSRRRISRSFRLGVSSGPARRTGCGRGPRRNSNGDRLGAVARFQPLEYRCTSDENRRPAAGPSRFDIVRRRRPIRGYATISRPQRGRRARGPPGKYRGKLLHNIAGISLAQWPQCPFRAWPDFLQPRHVRARCKPNAAGHVWTAFLRRKRPAIAPALRPTNGNHADQLNSKF